MFSLRYDGTRYRESTVLLGDRGAAMKNDASYWIQTLGLEPHPEGGYYRQTYRSNLLLPKGALPGDFGGPRPASTAIYFLLEDGTFSAFHRLRSDEVWHFYVGGALLVHVIGSDGHAAKIQLGSDPDTGGVLQAVVPAGCWFASEVRDRGAFALVGCSVAPGFDFEDFELAKREVLSNQYPQHQELIRRLTRN